MPIYEYFCGACQHHWELIITRDQSEAQRCPQCSEPARKELSAPAFQFKGSGWYATDYACKGKGSGEAIQSGPAADAPPACAPAPSPAPASGATPAAGSCGGGCAKP